MALAKRLKASSPDYFLFVADSRGVVGALVALGRERGYPGTRRVHSGEGVGAGGVCAGGRGALRGHTAPPAVCPDWWLPPPPACLLCTAGVFQGVAPDVPSPRPAPHVTTVLLTVFPEVGFTPSRLSPVAAICPRPSPPCWHPARQPLPVGSHQPVPCVSDSVSFLCA